MHRGNSSSFGFISVGALALCISITLPSYAGNEANPDAIGRAASALAMVPQTGAKMVQIAGEPRHVSIWDYNISPGGEHYFSICAEGTVSEYARLYRYYPEMNEARRVFRLEDVIVTHDEAVRPSKLHSSIDFLPDGRVIMATHTTAAAPNHPRWMPFAYYPDIREGYPGSNILIHDPKTGRTEDMGVPVPRESIYGGIYEPSTHSYYFTGYFRGHVYRFDLATRRVTDFGQAVEYGTWRWVSAADGAGAVVSWLRNGGKDYLVVVNRDPNRDMKFVATFVPGAGIVRRDGTTASAAAYADYFWLDPGDAAIFAATAKESK